MFFCALPLKDTPDFCKHESCDDRRRAQLRPAPLGEFSSPALKFRLLASTSLPDQVLRPSNIFNCDLLLCQTLISKTSITPTQLVSCDQKRT